MTNPDFERRPPVPPWQFAISLLFGFGLVLWLAGRSLGPDISVAEALVPIGTSIEIGRYLVWALLLATAAWLGRGGVRREIPYSAPTAWQRAVLFVLSSIMAFGLIAWVGWGTRHLPPAYHDEYSYLFQAHGFIDSLAKRGAHSTIAESPHFDQMHILNGNGMFASRYFPATGVWYAPFVLAQATHLGGWMLHALTCGFIALAASRWSMAAGISAAILVGTSPAMIVFNSAILSPGPTMLGLAIGWWGFQQAMVASRSWAGIVSGAAIGFAFLARPVTAAAIGLPWAIEALWRWKSGDRSLRRAIVATMVAFAPAPLLLAIHNHGITGSAFTTPYGLWTATYSPSHVYGFYNRTRGQEARTARTVVAYDDWATELSPERAVDLSAGRWKSALPWMGGFVPTVLLCSLALMQVRVLGNSALLPLTSILLLTLAYLPFAFEGIFGFSYIVEATPFVLLVASHGSARAIETLKASGRRGAAWIWWGIVAIPATVSLTSTLPQLFSPASEFVHPRIEMAERLALEENLAKDGPALILYAFERETNPHSTYVFNGPRFEDPLTGRSVARAWKLLDPSALMKGFAGHWAVYERTLGPDGRAEYRLVRPRVGR